MIFFSKQPLVEHDSCVLYWIVCFFTTPLTPPWRCQRNFFFLWKKTVQNFCMATFKNVETFITHCPPICSKFAMLLGVQKQRTHTHTYFFPLQMIMIAFWKCKDSSPLRFSHLASCCNIMRCGSLCDLERHLEKKSKSCFDLWELTQILFYVEC